MARAAAAFPNTDEHENTINPIKGRYPVETTIVVPLDKLTVSDLNVRKTGAKRESPRFFLESWSYFLDMEQTQLLDHLPCSRCSRPRPTSQVAPSSQTAAPVFF